MLDSLDKRRPKSSLVRNRLKVSVSDNFAGMYPITIGFFFSALRRIWLKGEARARENVNRAGPTKCSIYTCILYKPQSTINIAWNIVRIANNVYNFLKYFYDFLLAYVKKTLPPCKLKNLVWGLLFFFYEFRWPSVQRSSSFSAVYDSWRKFN